MYRVLLGRIIAEIILLLADKSLMDITLHDYIKEIRKEFDHFMAEYNEDFHRGSIQICKNISNANTATVFVIDPLDFPHTFSSVASRSHAIGSYC